MPDSESQVPLRAIMMMCHRCQNRVSTLLPHGDLFYCGKCFFTILADEFIRETLEARKKANDLQDRP